MGCKLPDKIISTHDDIQVSDLEFEKQEDVATKESVELLYERENTQSHGYQEDVILDEPNELSLIAQCHGDQTATGTEGQMDIGNAVGQAMEGADLVLLARDKVDIDEDNH